MTSIRAISFDLDNTLWDIAPVIQRAEENSYRYIQSRFPRIVERYSLEDIRARREQNWQDHPEIRHDLTEQRRLLFAQLLGECDYSEHHSSELLERFIADRNRVTLYPDVLPALERLSSFAPLVSLSDGNACLDTIGIGQYFVAAVSAADVGAMKPDPKGFQRVSAIVDASLSDILHVGDHPLYDMFGARNAGMQTMWMVRSADIAESWDQEFEPDYRARSLFDLVDIVCS